MYWLSVTAGTETGAFGWMTSATNAFDNAVYGHLDTNGTPIGDWNELIAPQTGRSLDLAFALTTTNQPTPPPPPTTISKWVQYPNLANGLDVNGTSGDQTLTLADDFPCREAGPITNIQLWGSWQNDVAPAPSTFEVSIWSDSPPTPANTTFSEPWQRLWHQTYSPGEYSVTYYANGTEQFYDESTGAMSAETNVWLYSFDVPAANAFCQQGRGHTYWVSVAVQPPATCVSAVGLEDLHQSLGRHRRLWESGSGFRERARRLAAVIRSVCAGPRADRVCVPDQWRRRPARIAIRTPTARISNGPTPRPMAWMCGRWRRRRWAMISYAKSAGRSQRLHGLGFVAQ